MNVTQTIRGVLAQYGGLAADPAEIADDADLYRLGLTSHASVNLMLALEDALAVEFADTMLRKATFESVAAIRTAIAELGVTDEEEEVTASNG